MKSKYILPVLITVWAITGCEKTAETAPQKQAFAMSDKMYNESTFATAAIQPGKNELRLFGKVTADNNNMAQVYPAVSGSVITINAELGDYVKQGQLLASVRSSEVAGYQGETSGADADVAIAERNLQSVKDMYEGKLASEKELVVAQKELDKARAQKNRMKEVNDIYKFKKGSVYNMYAPISGYVVYKDISPNEMLTGNRDEAVFTIAKLDNVWVMANVNESDLGRVKQGQEVSIKTVAYPDNRIKGKIDKVFNVIDPETRAAKALIKVPNPDVRLKPEMNASITVQYTDEGEYLAVPGGAVIFDKNKYFVMVFKGRDNIETREVTPHRTLDAVTYISEGLKVGEKVIVKNNLLVYNAVNN